MSIEATEVAIPSRSATALACFGAFSLVMFASALAERNGYAEFADILITLAVVSIFIVWHEMRSLPKALSK
tara:strand:+ start:96 stop:308 length:213 start_codon:yes stop_codon:yes gene_type:complete